MSLKDTMQDDIENFIEADLEDQVFTWQGEDFACHAGSLTSEGILEAGGIAIEADKILIVRKNVFSDVFPQEKQQLVYDTVTYRIDKVLENTNKAFYKLILTDINRGI